MHLVDASKVEALSSALASTTAAVSPRPHVVVRFENPRRKPRLSWLSDRCHASGEPRGRNLSSERQVEQRRKKIAGEEAIDGARRVTCTIYDFARKIGMRVANTI
jgi:hypothetical protein